jgi:hypothetical protein
VIGPALIPLKPPGFGASTGNTRTGATAGITAGGASGGAPVILAVVGFWGSTDCGSNEDDDISAETAVGGVAGVAGCDNAASGCDGAAAGCGVAGNGALGLAAADKSAGLTRPLRLSAFRSNWNLVSGTEFCMALASLGARTPFITRTPSNAVTFALSTFKARLGLAAAGVGSALDVFAAFSFAGFISLLPAMTGIAVMARNSKLDDNFLTLDIDVGS